MTRSMDAATLAAINASDRLVLRDFIWFNAKNRSTGAPVEVGMWTGEDTIPVNVIDPNTGGAVSRNYTGDGSIIELGSIPLVIDMTIQTVPLELSNIAPVVQTLVRTLDPRHAAVQIHRGFYNPETHQLVSEPTIQFIGIVNDIDINTPAVGDQGAISVELVGQTRELTRTYPAKRSSENQKLRNASDEFYSYTGVAGTWQREIRWGESPSDS